MHTLSLHFDEDAIGCMSSTLSKFDFVFDKVNLLWPCRWQFVLFLKKSIVYKVCGMIKSSIDALQKVSMIMSDTNLICDISVLSQIV